MNDTHEPPAGVRLPAGIELRRPTEADFQGVSAVIDEWWGGRRMRALLPRLWLQHFTGTSWIAEDEETRRLAGFLVGFISQDHPDTAYVHMIAVDPNRRQSGLGQALYAAFFDDVAARGIVRVRAVTWPGNRQSVAFHRALGFRLDEGPGTRPIHGIPAYADYDGDNEDRVSFVRDL